MHFQQLECEKFAKKDKMYVFCFHSGPIRSSCHCCIVLLQTKTGFEVEHEVAEEQVQRIEYSFDK